MNFNTKQIETTRDILRFARYELTNNLPYIARILLMLHFEASDKIPTLATNKQCVVFYNPLYIEKLTNAEINAVLLHEALHIVCKHWSRMSHREPTMWNIAGDIAINQIVDEYSSKLQISMKLPKEVVTYKSYNPNLPINLSAEEYYDLISNKPALNNDSVGSGKCGSCAGSDEDESLDADGSGENSKSTENRFTEEELNVAAFSAAKAIAQEGKLAGSLPAGLQRWVEMQFKPPKIKWSSILRFLIHRSFAASSGKNDYTYSKPSRRQATFGYGPKSPILPALRGFKKRGAVAVDTSGSMGSSELIAAIVETEAIIKETGGEVDFYTCDTQVHSAKKVSNVKDIVQNLKGGGGTELSPIFDRVKQDKLNPSFIVVITDGFCSVPQNHPQRIPVFYVIVGKGSKDPGFKGRVLFANKD